MIWLCLAPVHLPAGYQRWCRRNSLQGTQECIEASAAEKVAAAVVFDVELLALKQFGINTFEGVFFLFSEAGLDSALFHSGLESVLSTRACGLEG